MCLSGLVWAEIWEVLDNFILPLHVTGKLLVKDFANHCDSLQEHQLHIKADSVIKCHCTYSKAEDKLFFIGMLFKNNC